MPFPALHGNWVDFAMVAFTLFYLWDGWGRGFLEQFLEVGVFVLAFALALRLYPFFAFLLINQFSFSQSLAKAIGFFSLGLIFEQILANLAGKIVIKIPAKIRKHKINLWFAIIPLLGNAVVIIAFVLTLLLGLPIQPQIKSAITSAKLAPPLIATTQRIERAMGNIFGEALSDTFNFITIPSAPISQTRVKLNFNLREFTIDEKTETEMLALINSERRQWGLSELRADAKLRDLARMYAKDMFERGYFSHYNPEEESPFDRMEKEGISYATAGENLALAPNITIAHQGLMDSQGHRENILNSLFGSVGIGVIDGGIHGKMFVQEFTD